MFTIAIATNKGGSGKTTTAINLAVAAGKGALLVDLDPQASAVVWGEQRNGKEPGVLGIQGYQLEKVLESAEDNGAKFAFIDTAPHSETTALTACRKADLVLCPCRPSLADIRALSHTVDLVKLAKARGVVVLNAIPTAGLKRPLAEIRVIPLTSTCDDHVAGLLECTTRKNIRGVRSAFSV